MCISTTYEKVLKISSSFAEVNQLRIRILPLGFKVKSTRIFYPNKENEDTKEYDNLMQSILNAIENTYSLVLDFILTNLLSEREIVNDRVNNFIKKLSSFSTMSDFKKIDPDISTKFLYENVQKILIDNSEISLSNNLKKLNNLLFNKN